MSVRHSAALWKFCRRPENRNTDSAAANGGNHVINTYGAIGENQIISSGHGVDGAGKRRSSSAHCAWLNGCCAARRFSCRRARLAVLGIARMPSCASNHPSAACAGVMACRFANTCSRTSFSSLPCSSGEYAITGTACARHHGSRSGSTARRDRL